MEGILSCEHDSSPAHASRATNFQPNLGNGDLGAAPMAASSNMKAVVLTKEFKLEHQTRPIPTPKKGQVLVHVAASALNRRDYWITQKLYPKIKVHDTWEWRNPLVSVVALCAIF